MQVYHTAKSSYAQKVLKVSNSQEKFSAFVKTWEADKKWSKLEWKGHLLIFYVIQTKIIYKTPTNKIILTLNSIVLWI